eukprot:6210528-Pleurochrysis_carterae.AAC.2
MKGDKALTVVALASRPPARAAWRQGGATPSSATFAAPTASATASSAAAADSRAPYLAKAPGKPRRAYALPRALHDRVRR